MPEVFDQDALAKLSGNAANDTALQIKPHPQTPMDPAEVSPRDADRIRAQQAMERAVGKAQEANCGLNGSLKCNETIGNEARSQGIPKHNNSRER